MQEVQQPSVVSQDSGYAQVSTVTDTPEDSEPSQESSQESSQEEPGPAPTPTQTQLSSSSAEVIDTTEQATPPQDLVGSSLAPQQVTVSSGGVGVVQPTPAPIVEPLARTPSSSEGEGQQQRPAAAASPVVSHIVISSSEPDIGEAMPDLQELPSGASPMGFTAEEQERREAGRKESVAAATQPSSVDSSGEPEPPPPVSGSPAGEREGEEGMEEGEMSGGEEDEVREEGEAVQEPTELQGEASMEIADTTQAEGTYIRTYTNAYAHTRT